MFQRMVRQQVAEHVLLKCTSRSCAGLSDLACRATAVLKTIAAAATDHAGCSTKVSCGTSSSPRVSRLNSSVRTNATATPTVALSIGIAKPCGWLAASASPLIDHCLQVDIRGSRWPVSRRLRSTLINGHSQSPSGRLKRARKQHAEQFAPNFRTG
jgi:hypothetical protein